jgi:hypothetical protein
VSTYDLYRVSLADVVRQGYRDAIVGTGVTEDPWLLSEQQARALRNLGVACTRLTEDEAREWERARLEYGASLLTQAWTLIGTMEEE